MKKRTFSLIRTFLLSLLIINIVQGTQYLQNINFATPTCPTLTTTGCISATAADNWIGYDNLKSSTQQAYVLRAGNLIRTDSTAEPAIQLSDAVSSQLRTCIRQPIAFMAQGSYTLKIITLTDKLQTTYSKLQLYYELYTASQTIYSETITLANQAQITQQATITLTQNKNNLNIQVCGKNPSSTNIAIAIKRVSLDKIGDTCPTGSSVQTMVDATLDCVPNQVVFNSYNCWRYKLVGGVYSCGQCNQASNSAAKFLRPLATSPYYGCAQVNIPGAATYKVTPEFDTVSGLWILTSDTCISAFTAASYSKVVVPSSTATTKDQVTGIACKAYDSTVKSYQIVNGQYKIVECTTSTDKIIDLINPTAQTCISASDDYYDAECLTYQYDASGDPQCQSCKVLFTRVQVAVAGTPTPTWYDCTQDATETLPFVTKYQISGGLYYAYDNTVCQTGATAIQIATGLYGCTKFQILFGLAGTNMDTCDIYARPKLTDTTLACSTCDNGKSPTLCKIDNSDGCANDQIKVNVLISGTSTPTCSKNGFISYCSVYQSITAVTLVLGSCNTCQTDYSLATSTTGTQICIKTTNLVTNCLSYNALQECVTCKSGTPYNPTLGICPQSAAAIIKNCLKAQISSSGTTIRCTVCQTGYVLNNDYNMSRCIKTVTYCQNYTLDPVNATCQTCIPGYFLFNNTCYLSSSNCVKTDPATGACQACNTGYVVQNGNCVKNTICSSSQYKNAAGECINGNIANCQTYISPTGQCASCMTGFKFDINYKCISSSVNCPSNTPTITYLINNGKCVATDANCAQSNADGTCPICKPGYYSQNGKCYLIMSSASNNTASQNVTQSDNFLTDQFGYKYLLNADGSRKYYTGPWVGLNVWVDQLGNLYVINADQQTRGYLTGLLQGRVAYKDANGYWYANNPDGSRLYYTGPYAGKSVFTDGQGYFFTFNADGSRLYLTGPYTGKSVYIDSNGYYYVQNPDQSITYLNGPYTGQTFFKGPQDYLYSLNSDGSRRYITGPWVGQTVYVDSDGRLYVKNGSTSITFLSGPYTNQTAFYDNNGNLYIQNPDGSRTYISGPYNTKTVFTDNAGFLYTLNPDNSRTYLTGPFAGKIIFVDNSGYLYFINPDGSRQYITGPFTSNPVFIEPGTNYLYYLNPDSSRTYLTGPNAQQIVYPDQNGNQYTLNTDGSRTYLTGPYKNRIVFVDNTGYLYTKNPDGSITYLSGPNQGKIIFTDNQGTYYTNPNGSRTYLTGPNAGKIVFIDSIGSYILNPDGSRTYLTGTYTNKIVFVDNNGIPYIKNPDGSITYLTGPNANKIVFTTFDGYQYIKNPDNTITYLTGPNVGKIVYVDPTNNLPYTKNPDGSRVYLVDPSTQDLPKPTSQQIISNLVDGNAKVVTSGGKTFITYTDPTGKTYALPADQTLPDGITFTDSQGVQYFLSNVPGSKPQQILTNVNGGKYVINPDGTMKTITSPTSNTSNPTSPSTPTSNNPTTTTPSSPNNNLANVIPNIITSGGKTSIVYTDSAGRTFTIATDQTLSDGVTFTDPQGVQYFLSNIPGSKPQQILTDTNGNKYILSPDGTRRILRDLNTTNQNTVTSPTNNSSGTGSIGANVQIDADGYRYQIVNGVKRYLSGPNAGRTVTVDQNGYEYCQNMDGSRAYTSGPNKGFTAYRDSNGYWYIKVPNGANLYITGPYKGQQLFADQNGYLFTINSDKTRKYVTGPSAGKVVTTDIDGYAYTVNKDGSATYTNGPYNGVVLQKDSSGYYRLNSDGTKTYVTGSNAGKSANTDLTGQNYILNSDGSRTYNSGPYSGKTVYVDFSGYLYTIDSQGQRTYLTGPNAGKSVSIDMEGNSYNLNSDGTRTYTTGPLKGKTVYVDGQGYLYTINTNGSRLYVSGPMNGRTVQIDSSGFLYVIDSTGKRTYLNGPMAGRTVDPSSTSSSSTNSNSFVTPGISTGQIFIYQDNQGTFILNVDERKYLSLFQSNTANGQFIYRDQSGSNYIVYVDQRGFKYTKNSDNTRNYMNGFSNNTLNTYIVYVDKQGNQYSIYSDNLGNRYIVYTDPINNSKYYLDKDGSKRYLGRNSPISNIDDNLVEPNTLYKLYTDGNGNMYIIYTDSNGRQYTLNPDKTKRYLDNANGIAKPANNLVFRDDTGLFFALDTDGSRNYLKIDNSKPAGNFVSYTNQNGFSYQIYTDPSGNKYTLSITGSKNYITGYSTQLGNNFKTYTDVLGFNYKVYTLSNGDTYTIYADYQGKSFYYNSDGTTTMFTGLNIVNPNNNMNSNVQGGAITINNNVWSGYVFTDESGNRYVLGQDKTWNYITLSAGYTSSSNPALYTSFTGANYFIYIDSNGNRYLKNSDGTNTYITGYPSTTTGLLTSFTDALGGSYSVYTDSSKNRYVTYKDSLGQFYYNSTGSKVYLKNTSMTNQNTGTQGQTTGSGVVQNNQNQMTGNNFVYIFSDATSGGKYTLSNTGVRIPLTVSSTTASSVIYTDTLGNRYTIYLDPSGNYYTLGPQSTRVYSTSFPSVTTGTTNTIVDSLGTNYVIYNDQSGNKYITYSDSNGRFYYGSNGQKVYLNSGTTTNNMGSTTTNSNTNNVGTVLSSPVYVYSDDAGNKYILSRTNTRTYLTPTLTSASSITYTDPTGVKYVVYKDPTTGNLYTSGSSGSKIFLTGTASSTSGSPVTYKDSVGTTYTIISDPSGNRYIRYTDPKGQFYYDKNSVRQYLTKSSPNNLSADTGDKSSLWQLVESLQNMLAQCQGAMFK